MVLDRPGSPLRLADLPVPEPGPGQLLIRVLACAVCRTDLHVVDGELPNPKSALVPGHQIVGTIAGVGPSAPLGTGPSAALGAGPSASSGAEPAASRWQAGDLVGVPWLASACGQCRYCRDDQENLCDRPRFTGYQVDGGFAELTLADHRFAVEIPRGGDPVHLSPLLCGGAIGYRAYSFAGDARRLGLYGFGAAAHILVQLARSQGREVYAFVRPGDEQAKRFALKLGARWAGDSSQAPPEPLDAAIIFAPVGSLVPAALAAVRKGGTVVCGGIHMSDIPPLPYSLLWGERVLRSVANLKRSDASQLIALAMAIPIRTEVRRFRLEEANEALLALRCGKLSGSAVLEVASS